MTELNTVQMNRALTVLRRLKPRERLRVIAQALPEAERELEMPAPATAPIEWDDASLAAAEAALEQTLLEKGLLSEIPARLSPTDYALPEPIEVPGVPLSEIIIAERR